jgi:hypothetical protein
MLLAVLYMNLSKEKKVFLNKIPGFRLCKCWLHVKVHPHYSCSCDSLCGQYDKSRDEQYVPHEPLVHEAPLVVSTSKGFATSRPSHVDDDKPWSFNYSLYTLRVIWILTCRNLTSNWSSVDDDLWAQVKSQMSLPMSTSLASMSTSIVDGP